MKRKMRGKQRGAEEGQFRPQWWRATRGTESLRHLTRRVLTLPLEEEARPALRAPGAPRARNGRHLVLRIHLQVPKVSLISSYAHLWGFIL